jgi:hypothetical protein
MIFILLFKCKENDENQLKFQVFFELGNLSSFTRFATYIDFFMIFILLFKCKENDENQLKFQVLNNSLQDVILILYAFPLCSRKTMEF